MTYLQRWRYRRGDRVLTIVLALPHIVRRDVEQAWPWLNKMGQHLATPPLR